MPRSIRVAPEYIKQVNLALRRHGFPSRKALYEELGISRSTTDKFFTGKAVDYSYFVEISERLGLDWHAIAYIEEEPPIQVEPISPPDTPLTKKGTGMNWRQVCQDMLSHQNQRRLTTNPLTAGDGVAFELDEIYVPLGLVERKQRHRVSSDVAPEQGSQLYVGADLVSTQDEIVQTFQQDEFFEQVLRPGRSRRIAIVGEPGAGKTTLLQKIAAWILDNSSDLPIWISLADLQGKTLEQYLLEDWLKAATRKVRVTEAMQDALGELFNSKRVWLLLDAVDEMSIGAYGNAPLQWIANQITGWVGDARVVLTCRLNVWDAGKNALETFETYRNLDFNYGDAQTPDQIGQFIKRWFNSYRDVHTPNRVGQLINRWFNHKLQLAERLRTELDQPGRERIKDAVKNPLRLALLCQTWSLGRGGLPNTKAGLYQQFTEAFYKWKQDRFPTTSRQQQKLNKALGELAKRAISEERTKFRLRHRLVCEVLGNSDEELFQLALQLGWLNQVGVAAEAEKLGESVYAFFHPTFQEYFAAQAIDNWHFFLNYDVFNPEQSTYRIFEPQWKEVILLWLGREDLPQSQKVAFIKALVTFEDGCGHLNPYGLRAYLLAIAGIAELENPDSAEFLDWSHWFHSSKWLREQSRNIKQKPQKWSTFFTLIERAAQGRLRETEYSRAIETLVDVLREGQHSRTYHQCLVALGEIGVNNQRAINAVIELLQTIHNSGKLDDWTLFQCVMTLRKIGVGNQEASAALRIFLERIKNISDLERSSVELLTNVSVELRNHVRNSKIDATETRIKINQIQNQRENRGIYHETIKTLKLSDCSDVKSIINTLINGLHHDVNAQHWLANQFHKVSSISKQKIIKALSKILSNTQNSRTRWKIADSLGQIDPGNIDANKALIDLMRNKDYRSEAVWSLKKTLRGNLFALTVSGLKDSLEEDDERCYEIIWYCAQNMTYPDFRRAWYRLDSPPLITQKLNLAHLPQKLCTAIANDPVLSQTIHLICIDASKFIDRDNPASKIYTQMVRMGCPKCEDGTPKTMQELQAYWDMLDTDKFIVLVFYEGTGFSATFLNALSKFDGAICVITAQPIDNIPLHWFSPERAIADIVEWIKKVALEA